MRAPSPAARLPSILIELAAGRVPAPDADVARVLAIASEHRMTGLLWTWAQRHLDDPTVNVRLAMQDLAIRAHHSRVMAVLQDCVSRLDAVGIEVATVKGVTAEARWYVRAGERPCSDVDLLLAPHHLHRAGEVVAFLQPEHPWANNVGRLGVSGRLQAVTMRVSGVDVDLHLDLLKLGIPTRQAREIWGETLLHSLPDGGCVRVLDDTSALLHLLIHLNKDRFQRLLGYADIPRIIAAGEVDWQRLQRVAQREGIDVSALRTLRTVLTQLSLPWPDQLPVPRGPRSLLWHWLWRDSIRLRGHEGRLRFTMRQNWIALLARGRGVEALWWWLRALGPPRQAVEIRYGDIRGPYLWKLVRGRSVAMLEKRRAIAESHR